MRACRFLGAALFGLALAVWLAAPLAGRIATPRSDAAAVARVLTCIASATSGVADAHPGLPGHNNGGDRDACMSCQVCCAAAAPLAARPGEVGMAPVQCVSPAWTVADRALPTPRREHSRQARAPPALS